ncbi:unnamed protein product [Linum trigynum]|uniref:Uncharacterized protein n=1 Tax=Linum trigynum TaxID=586398 RepID=A0AAV2EBI5_9ROSI
MRLNQRSIAKQHCSGRRVEIGIGGRTDCRKADLERSSTSLRLGFRRLARNSSMHPIGSGNSLFKMGKEKPIGPGDALIGPGPI